MAAAFGVKRALSYVFEYGTINGLQEVMEFGEFTDLVRLDKIRELEGMYLSEDEIIRRYGSREGLERAAAERH